MAGVASLGSFSDNTNPSTGISGAGVKTSAASVAGDKVVATLHIPNSNPTSVAVTIGGVSMTEIAGSRSTRTNNTIVTLYLDSTVAINALIVASWVNTGTTGGGGALIIVGALTPTNSFAAGAPELAAIANSNSTTPSTGTTGTPADTTANYFAYAALGVVGIAVSGKETPDNSYTALTQVVNVTRTIVLDAAALEFTSPPVAAKSETWTVDSSGTGWNGARNWMGSIILFKEAVPGAPTNTAVPVVTGSATVGQNLVTSDGSWTGSPTSFTYSWQRDVGTAGSTWLTIPGATTNTYTVTADDLGSKLRSQVVANNASGSSLAASSIAGSTVPAPAGALSYRIVAGPIAQSDAQVHSTTLTKPVLAGDLMVLFVSCSNAALTDGNGNRQDVGTVTDAGGNVWTQDCEAFNDTNIIHSAQAFSTHSGAGSAYGSSVTMTVHGGTGAGGYHGQSPYWYVVAVSTGDSRVLALDGQAHNVDILTTHTSPSITTIQNDAIIFGYHNVDAGGAAPWWTQAAGFTEIVDSPSALGNGGESDYSISGEVKVVAAGFTGTTGGTTASNKPVTNLAVAYGATAPSGGSATMPSMPIASANRSITQAVINATAGTPQDLVAIPGAGMKIYVVTIVLSMSAAGTIKFTEGTGPTDLSGAISLGTAVPLALIGSDEQIVLQTNTANSKLSIAPVTGNATGWIRYFTAAE